jgi:hypothetical protein
MGIGEERFRRIVGTRSGAQAPIPRASVDRQIALRPGPVMGTAVDSGLRLNVG